MHRVDRARRYLGFVLTVTLILGMVAPSGSVARADTTEAGTSAAEDVAVQPEAAGTDEAQEAGEGVASEPDSDDASTEATPQDTSDEAADDAGDDASDKATTDDTEGETDGAKEDGGSTTLDVKQRLVALGVSKAADLVGKRRVAAIEDPIVDSDGNEVLKTTIAIKGRAVSDDNIYEYKTSESSKYVIAISNSDNTVMSNVVRVYFSYDGDGQEMGTFPAGAIYNLKNPQGSIYPMKVVETDVPNVFYYEITGIKPGETLSFDNSVAYPSPNTRGGTLRIWTKTITPSQSEELEGKVVDPTGLDYLQIEWDTDPVTYSIKKTNSSVYSGKTASVSVNEKGEAPVRNLAWLITESNASGSSASSIGQDHILRVDYTDVIDLPETVAWRPEVLAVLESGVRSSSTSSEDGWWTENVSTSIDTTSTTCNTIRVRANGVVYDVVYMNKKSGGNASGITGLTPQIVTENGEKKLELTWYCTNSSAVAGQSRAAEYGVHNFYLRVGDNVVLADLDKIKETYQQDPSSINSLITVNNDANEVRHYSYSPDQTAEAQTATRNVTVNTGWSVTKSWDNSPTSSRSVYGGNDDFSTITIKNTGILPIEQWGTEDNPGRIATDTLHYAFYITPENIEAMLDATTSVGSGDSATTVPLGDWLTITINHASLFDPQYFQATEGGDQSNKYPSTINASSDANKRVFEAATFTIKKDGQGRTVVTLSGDTIGANNKAYVIGQDYQTLQDLFDAVGYFPTHNTTYALSYVTDGFSLAPGMSLKIPIKGTCKTTPMMLTSDVRRYYDYNIPTLRTNNTAQVSATVGESVKTVNPRTYRNSSGYDVHYWSSELYVHKSATSESGTSYSDGRPVPEGTVLNNRINGYNYGNYKYDTMTFADYMYGAEVLLVPKVQNPGLANAGLDTYESNGISYWLMNKPGTYENVIVGSTKRNGTQTYKATSIQVSKTGSGTSGSLNTTIIWEPIKNWHTTGSSSYKGYTDIYYKSIASAYWAGLVSSEGTGAGQRYSLANRAWLGDHQGHRLWDTYGLYYDSYRFDGKRILNSDGTTTTSSRIKNGETVTYQISITNNTSTPVAIGGSALRDALPNTYGLFKWVKGTNVKNLRYIAPTGSTIKAGDTSLDINGGTNPTDDYWRVVSSRNAPTRYTTSGSKPYEGGWDILWDNSFQVSLAGNGTLKILVDLTYPSREDGDAWDQYVAATKGSPIYNYFYFNNTASSVSHTLEAEGRPVLYKGVYDTGLTTHMATSSNMIHRGSYSSNRSRVKYVNSGGPVSYRDSDLKAETITYYTILYNGSYDRLYLSDMQDVLPRGFTFNSFCNTTASTSYLTGYYSGSNITSKSNTSYSSNFIGYTGNQEYLSATGSNTVYRTLTEGYSSNTSDKFVTISNADSNVDENTIRYVNAAISAKTEMVGGQQHVTYTFGSASTGYANSNIHYDSAAKRYYLNPGEAIRFGYNCLIDSYANTDDLATNTIAMPYYDHYGTGFELHAPSEEDGGAVQKVAGKSGITKNNDGGCELMTDDEVSSKYGMNTEDYQGDAYHTHDEGNWLVSDVTVERATMTPGIIKKVGGVSTKPVSDSEHYGSLGTNNTAMNGGNTSRFGTKYAYSCSSSDIINWRLCLYNEGEANTSDEDIVGMMSDYRVVDTVAAPYSFTGRVFYNLFRHTASTNSPSTYASQYLFTLDRRTEGDTSVRIGAGTSLSNSGATLHIGSAEDDSDDQWYQFGTDTKEGRVKIERDADENEVMTIEFKGSTYAIPGGCYSELALHTQFNKDQVIISEGKYNDAVLYPAQDYDPTKVAQGRARTKQAYDKYGNAIQVNDGVQSGDSVMLVQGYTSSSWKTVTQIDNTSNAARSDESDNYINLSERHDAFRYDLHVVGPEDVMAKIVIIDALPQEGDHSAFVEADKRNSDFTVSIDAENPEFSVALKPDNGKEVALKPGEYRLFVSSRTEFEKADWRGAGDGWTDITDLAGDELTAALAGVRSLRVIIEDPHAYEVLGALSDYKMANKCQVHIGFNAEVDDPEAKPGEYAWNSFGYTYTVPLTQNGTEQNSTGVSLDAQPLKVGVRFPAAPSLEKQLVVLDQVMVPKTETVEVPVTDDEGNPLHDEEGNPLTTTEERIVYEDVERQLYDTETGAPLYDEGGNPLTEVVKEPVMVPKTDEDGNPVMELAPHAAKEDLTFGFIVYAGDPIAALDDALDMEVADIAAALEDDDRAYIYVPITVKKGDSSAKVDLWGVECASTYDEETGEFVTDKNAEWRWRNMEKYTLLELPMGDYSYTLQSIKLNKVEHEDTNNLSFTNGNTSVLALAGVNEWEPEYVDVTGTKVWDDADNQDGVRPESVTVRLLADGEEIDSAEVTEDDDWKFSFEHLLKYHENGSLIQYKVTEDAVSDYSVSYEVKEVTGKAKRGNAPEAKPTLLDSLAGFLLGTDNSDGSDRAGESETTVIAYDYTVTNTHVPGKTSVTVTKTWDDDDNRDGIRAGSVTVHLLADGEDIGKTLELSDDNAWQGSFEELDEKKSGQTIVYTVTEDEIEGYTTEIAGDAEVGYAVTNSHTPEKTSVPVSKVWDDDDDRDRIRTGSVTVHLLADGEDTGMTIELSDDNAWQGTFTDLNVNEGGQKIAYTVEEDIVSGYVADITGDAEAGYVVTNIHTPGKTNVPVSKVWDDGDDKDGIRPASVTVHLLADGEDTGITLELSAANGWKGSFANFDMNEGGKAIAYTVTEDEVEGYTAEITGDAGTGYVVTNSHTPKNEPPKRHLVPRTSDLFNPGTAAFLLGLGVAIVAAGIYLKRRKS